MCEWVGPGGPDEPAYARMMGTGLHSGLRRLRLRAGMVLAAALLAIAGCGDKPEPKTIVVGANPAPGIAAAVPPAAPAPDALAPRYAATLADGIDFTKPGYPEFVAEVAGISSYEPWGRWTDANLAATASIRFRQALPARFTLELSVNAFGPNLGEPIRVKVGGIEKSFVHVDPRSTATYKLTFDNASGADRIEITPPKPVSPSELKVGDDSRRVGVGLIALRIRD